MPLSGLADFHDFHPADADFRAAVVDGLSADAKSIPCKFFYDETGSRLFEAICDLEEYYPTRTELGILQEYAAEIVAEAGDGCHLVEFGSGASRKVRLLLEAMDNPQSYVPIDISRDHLIQSAADLAKAFPDVPVVAICADYTTDFEFPDVGPGPRVGFFPGSTIGNFTPDEAVAFLTRAHDWLLGGGLIIGVDLWKDETTLQAAYDDGRGVTARFNKNLLARCNAELGADFDLDGFAHRAVVNDTAKRVEMHLKAKSPQTVRLDGRTFEFAPGETIHTECSHKFTVPDFWDIARAAGFEPVRAWCDEDELFSVHYLKAA